jgi:hypothetical protein
MNAIATTKLLEYLPAPRLHGLLASGPETAPMSKGAGVGSLAVHPYGEAISLQFAHQFGERFVSRANELEIDGDLFRLADAAEPALLQHAKQAPRPPARRCGEPPAGDAACSLTAKMREACGLPHALNEPVHAHDFIQGQNRPVLCALIALR